MTRRITLLTALLLAQLALAAGLAWRHQRLTAAAEPSPLLAFDAAAVDGIEIRDGDGHQVTLHREGGQWRIGERDGFPASASRVEDLLQRLAALRRGWPAATSGDARRRFQVADDRYQRRLRLRRGDQTLATLYLGTSPGFRQVHARVDGDGAIYAVAFNTYDAPARPDDWADRSVLHLPAADIRTVRYPDFTLQRDGQDGYRLQPPPPDGQRLDRGAAEQLVRRIADLGFLGVLGSQAQDDWHLDRPRLRFTVQRKGAAQPLEYRLSPLPQDHEPEPPGQAKKKDKDEKGHDAAALPADWVLQRSDLRWYLKVSSFVARDLQQTRRDLLQPVASEQGETQGEKGAAAADGKPAAPEGATGPRPAPKPDPAPASPR